MVTFPYREKCWWQSGLARHSFSRFLKDNGKDFGITMTCTPEILSMWGKAPACREKNISEGWQWRNQTTNNKSPWTSPGWLIVFGLVSSLIMVCDFQNIFIKREINKLVDMASTIFITLVHAITCYWISSIYFVSNADPLIISTDALSIFLIASIKKKIKYLIKKICVAFAGAVG